MYYDEEEDGGRAGAGARAGGNKRARGDAEDGGHGHHGHYSSSGSGVGSHGDLDPSMVAAEREHEEITKVRRRVS